MTQLDAINEILSVAGEAPINTLEDNENLDAINAIRLLNNETNALESRGWTYNTIESYTLHPDRETKRIRWIPGIIKIASKDITLIKRGDNLFNLSGNTDLFPAAIEATCIFSYGFDDMPAPFQEYVIARASYNFVSRYVGDESLARTLTEDIKLAWIGIQEHEMETHPVNILDNQDVQNARNR